MKTTRSETGITVSSSGQVLGAGDAHRVQMLLSFGCGADIAELADATKIDSRTLTTYVNRLIKRGLVYRAYDTNTYRWELGA
jgi:DNA-binding IclR family transcriptional regulator